MAKVIVVIAEKMFRDEEFAEPKAILASAGHGVVVASSSGAAAVGKLGMVVNPDLAIDAVSPGGFGAVVVVGGPGTPAYLWPNKRLHQIVKSINEGGGVVAAICLAPVVLARAGVIRGRRCTVFPTADSLREMTEAGGLLLKEHLVVDGNIVTADGPGAAKAFGEAIVRLLRAAR
jgi:protease I